MIALCFACAILLTVTAAAIFSGDSIDTLIGSDYIKWVDFNVPYEALEKALELDITSYETDTHTDWVSLLALLASKNGGDFSNYKAKQLNSIAQELQDGKSIAELTEKLKYFTYYQEAYGAVLSGLVGAYETQVKDEASGELIWETRYGLKGFSPIAKTFPYNDYDDFGTGRSYGYKRKHLGHDLMGQVGTPVIAVETGTVEKMGWNQYGGWRIGIRSLDGKRYYYYAHLRKNFPYRLDLKEGDTVEYGDVIGYLGRTGYSATENTNNIQQAHLHFGLQLIFDESQIEGNNEIWVDVYPLTRLLARHRSEVIKNEETKDYSRVYEFRTSSSILESPSQ